MAMTTTIPMVESGTDHADPSGIGCPNGKQDTINAIQQNEGARPVFGKYANAYLRQTGVGRTPAIAPENRKGHTVDALYPAFI